jgi:hypothetical protein
VWAAAAPLLSGQSVLLNEMMSANRRTLLDENGDSSDWLELFNPGAAPVNLAAGDCRMIQTSHSSDLS